MAVKEKVSVHQTEDARILFELECPKPVLCATPAKVCASSLCFSNYQVELWTYRTPSNQTIFFLKDHD